MSDHFEAPVAPRPVKIAAALIILYGVLVVLNAVILALGSKNWEGLFGAVIRFGGTVMVAGGITGLQRWAWWTAVIAGWLFCITSLLAALGLLLFGTTGFIQASGLVTLLSFGMAFVLGAALILLSSQETRLAFGIRNSTSRGGDTFP